jgi:hypothetical protein
MGAPCVSAEKICGMWKISDEILKSEQSLSHRNRPENHNSKESDILTETENSTDPIVNYFMGLQSQR